MEITSHHILAALIILCIVYVCLDSRKENLSNIGGVYLKPVSRYSEAAATPMSYSKVYTVTAKQCSDDSLNSEILDYQLSTQNRMNLLP